MDCVLTQSEDDVVGAVGGFAGVLAGAIRPIVRADIRRLESLGGSMLASTRDAALAEADAESRLKEQLDTHQIDNILLFGGNGTLTYIPPLLEAWGITCVGIPTTIDNDVSGTELTLGFDSACNYAYQAIDGVIATAHALPGRIFMVETLGGDTGYLALEVAYGAGAHIGTASRVSV